MLDERLNRRNQNLNYRIEMYSFLHFFESYRQRFSVSKKNSGKSKILLANCQRKKQRINFFFDEKDYFCSPSYFASLFIVVIWWIRFNILFRFDFEYAKYLISSYIIWQCIIKLYAYICIYVYIYHRFIAWYDYDYCIIS